VEKLFTQQFLFLELKQILGTISESGEGNGKNNQRIWYAGEITYVFGSK